MPGQFIGKDVQYNFEVTAGVQHPVVADHQFLAKLVVIDRVSVVHHGDPERGVEVERLCVFARARTHGRITHVPKSVGAAKTCDILCRKNVLYKAKTFFQVKHPVKCNDTGRVLPAVLRRHECIVQLGNHVAVVCNDTGYAAHIQLSSHGSWSEAT